MGLRLQGFGPGGLEPCNLLLRFPFGANSDSVVASRDDADQSSRDNWESDLFGARLDQIINMKHELVQLAGKFERLD